MHRDHDKIALHIPKNDMFWQLEKLRHHGATYALKHVLNQKSEAYLHTALFSQKWHKVGVFCTFFKDLKALLQISLTKHNYLSHLLPFWMQYIPKNPFFLMLEIGFLK